MGATVTPCRTEPETVDTSMSKKSSRAVISSKEIVGATKKAAASSSSTAAAAAAMAAWCLVISVMVDVVNEFACLDGCSHAEVLMKERIFKDVLLVTLDVVAFNAADFNRVTLVVWVVIWFSDPCSMVRLFASPSLPFDCSCV